MIKLLGLACDLISGSRLRPRTLCRFIALSSAAVPSATTWSQLDLRPKTPLVFFFQPAYLLREILLQPGYDYRSERRYVG